MRRRATPRNSRCSSARTLGTGSRRNLFGLKWPALALNVIVVAICGLLLWHRGTFDMGNDLIVRTSVVLIVAAIHAFYFAFVVTKNGVKDAARKYGGVKPNPFHRNSHGRNARSCEAKEVEANGLLT